VEEVKPAQTKALLFLLCCGFVFTGLARGQTRTPEQSEKPEHPPMFQCEKAKLVSHTGQPFAAIIVKIKLFQVDWGKGPHPDPSGAVIHWKMIKKLKTHSTGELTFPKLKEGVYQLELAENGKPAFGAFEIPSDWHPVSCSLVLVVQDGDIRLKQGRDDMTAPQGRNELAQRGSAG
jgi:hypothetical protein